MTTTAQDATLTLEDLLRAAADRIQRYGHLKQAFYASWADNPYEGPCCMAGAIRLSYGLPIDRMYWCHDEQPELIQKAEQLLAECAVRASSDEGAVDLDLVIDAIADFNDADNCDADSAIELLRDAAELAR